MKTLLTSYLIIFSAVFFTACSSSNSVTYDYLEIEKRKIILKPLIAELEVSNTKVKLNKIYFLTTVEDAKVSAMGDFIKTHDCDVIIEPVFTVVNAQTVRGKKKPVQVELELVGYPGKYKNIHTYNSKNDSLDYEILKVATVVTHNDTTVTRTGDVYKINKGTAKVAIGGIIAILLAFRLF